MISQNGKYLYAKVAYSKGNICYERVPVKDCEGCDGLGSPMEHYNYCEIFQSRIDNNEPCDECNRLIRGKESK